ncbi:MAG: DUF6174 domain-containing protein [Candidatus Electrothrix aestuarii]|uniref:DUF6174 domain-containing protein n=1 Tax=Candidatus Electrothrix aestuarii TaxID=3062594 RepID=A0AAU8LZ41_9BACT|nr:DUF6174 domain-containing protein [Candidatus Electrothrix aestuarii]
MKIIQLVVLALIVSLFGCTHPTLPHIDDNPQQEALNKNHALWKNSNRSTYTYTYKRVCFCPQEEDIVVDVQYGNVVSAHYYPSDNPVMPERLDSLMTVEELFEVIQKAINDDVAQLDVTYNAQLGYPERIYIDVDERMADEEMEHQVSNLH